MTPDAAAAVRAEAASVEAELARIEQAAPDRETGDGTTTPIVLPVVRLRRRLATLHLALDEAVVELDPCVAAVGRRVTVAVDDDAPETFSLVLPGDGDPARGWISIDAPLGAAVSGTRAGDRAVVDAPGGAWVVSVLEVR